MRVSHYFLMLLFGIGMAVFNACTEPRDFSANLREIDSLQLVMTHAEEEIDNITSPIADTITAQLKYIQENFKGTMQQPMARTLLRYGHFREKTNQIHDWKDSLHLRKEALENELNLFRKTLAEMATHDAEKREITALYADSVFHELESAQQFWHTKINEWIQITRNVNEEWLPLHDTIVLWTDSIQSDKRQ